LADSGGAGLMQMNDCSNL